MAFIKDLAGDFDAASDAIGRCKSVQKAHEAPYWCASEKVHGQMRELIAAVTRDRFRSWRDAVGHLTEERVSLLTGFPRSGTTLLEQILDAHYDLASSEERDFIGRELFYEITARQEKLPLIDVLNELRVDRICAERQRYFRAMEYLLGQPLGGRMHLDKNPAYNLTIPLVLSLISRDPADYRAARPTGRGIELLLATIFLFNAVSVRFLDAERTAARYAIDMTAWLKFRELIDVPWCEIRYEDTVANLEQQARRCT